MSYATVDGGFTSVIRTPAIGSYAGALVYQSTVGGNTITSGDYLETPWQRGANPYSNLTANVLTPQFAVCDATSIPVGVVTNVQSSWSEFALGGHVRASYGGGSTALTVNDLVGCNASGAVIPWNGTSPVIGRALENINGSGNRVWISLLDSALPLGQSQLSMTLASNHLNVPTTSQTMSWSATGIVSSSSSTVVGNDNRGTANVVASGSVASTPSLTVTFGTAYPVAPKVMLTPASALAAQAGWFVSSTTTGFTITYSLFGTLSGTASFNYLILP